MLRVLLALYIAKEHWLTSNMLLLALYIAKVTCYLSANVLVCVLPCTQVI